MALLNAWMIVTYCITLTLTCSRHSSFTSSLHSPQHTTLHPRPTPIVMRCTHYTPSSPLIHTPPPSTSTHANTAPVPPRIHLPGGRWEGWTWEAWAGCSLVPTQARHPRAQPPTYPPARPSNPPTSAPQPTAKPPTEPTHPTKPPTHTHASTSLPHPNPPTHQRPPTTTRAPRKKTPQTGARILARIVHGFCADLFPVVSRLFYSIFCRRKNSRTPPPLFCSALFFVPKTGFSRSEFGYVSRVVRALRSRRPSWLPVRHLPACHEFGLGGAPGPPPQPLQMRTAARTQRVRRTTCARGQGRLRPRRRRR